MTPRACCAASSLLLDESGSCELATPARSRLSASFHTLIFQKYSADAGSSAPSTCGALQLQLCYLGIIQLTAGTTKGRS